MENQEREKPTRELVEAGMAFRVVQEKAGKVQGWLRMVRHAVGIPVAEMARRMGVGGSEVYRMEYAEGRGVIELQTLRRAAEALGCDLVYGLSPREETLAAIAADTEVAREQKRAEARERRLEKARERRREAARKRWAAQETGTAGGGVAGVLETVPDAEDGGRAEADSQAEATGAALEAGAAEGTGAGAAEEGDESEVRRGTRE